MLIHHEPFWSAVISITSAAQKSPRLRLVRGEAPDQGLHHVRQTPQDVEVLVDDFNEGIIVANVSIMD